jgi:hypothetical protein
MIAGVLACFGIIALGITLAVIDIRIQAALWALREGKDPQ